MLVANPKLDTLILDQHFMAMTQKPGTVGTLKRLVNGYPKYDGNRF